MQSTVRSSYFTLAGALLLLVAAFLPLYHAYSSQMRDSLLIAMTRYDSLEWTELFAKEADSIEQLIQGGRLSSEDTRIMTAAAGMAGIRQLDLFDAHGRPATSLPVGTVTSNHAHEALADHVVEQMRRSEPLITLEHDISETDDSTVVSAYVPVFADGALVAVVELEVDASQIAATIDATFSAIFIGTSFSAAIMFSLVLALVLIRRNEMRRAQKVITHLDQFDRLTNVYNRRGLAICIDEAVSRAQPDGNKVVVACIDIDRFKSINEQFGLAAGDRVLKDFAERVQTNMRDDDVLARLGNDAFALVIGGVDASANIPGILERIKLAVSEPFELQAHAINLSICIGIAIAPDHAVDAASLMKMAETALHQAKLAGRGSVKVFSKTMDAEARDGLLLETELRRAIKDDLIAVHYQPQVDIETGLVVGCEALVRWHHPELGSISPARFIPIAEDSGLIHALSERVMRRACSDAMQWPIPLSIAVNLSPAELGSGLVPTIVSDVLVATGLPAERLELEVTEGMVMQKSDTTLHTLQDLRDIGVGIAIDDFGTGYSSLSYLANFPFTKLKIDRAFVVASGQFKNMTAIIKAIVSLGKALNVTVIVEGVETKSQLERMRRAGCRLVQGYYFSKPLTQDELIGYLNATKVEPIQLRR